MSDTLTLSGIEKAFGPNRVLFDVGLSLPAGVVTVLMGANGAGKSTLVKILSGVHAPDAGQMQLQGVSYRPGTPVEAIGAGVVTVHQSIDDGVVPELDVAANLMLDSLVTGRSGFWYRRRLLRRQAQEIAERMGLSFDLSRPVCELSLADRQLVGIARAMATEPRLLILDEPTSSLSSREAERLFALIDRLREQGVAILYISHRLSDIRRIADRILVMRDGRIAGEFNDSPLDTEAALAAMLGRRVARHPIGVQVSQQPVLQLEHVQLRADTQPFSFTVGRGEVVAIAGLVGSGKGTLAETLFGLRKPVAGSMSLDERAFAPGSVSQAIARGVHLTPRERARNAVVPGFDLAANMSLPFTARFAAAGFLRRRAEREAGRRQIDSLGIVCRSVGDSIGTLSGGNQQKVMMGRWLSQPCRLLVLDEPFQGVDIQARRDISARLRADAGRRATLIMVSEIDEALEVADRILIMVEHTITGEHINRGVDLERLLMDMAASVQSPANPPVDTAVKFGDIPTDNHPTDNHTVSRSGLHTNL